MKTNIDPQKIEELLSRGVENIYPKREFLEAQLKSGKQLTLYTGYDPTAPTLHIGHGITMLKLRQFQELGHKVIMLIGDFTGMIGDPTDKTSARQKLTRKQVLENCKNYKKQAGAILNFSGKNPVQVKFNSKWLAKMSFADVVELSSHFTVGQMADRDMFKRRLGWRSICLECKHENLRSADYHKSQLGDQEKNKVEGIANLEWVCDNCKHKYKTIDGGIWSAPQPVYLHEFLYPLMQGYDSVAMDVDGEVGGNDQTFNMLTGRDLMKIGIKIGDKQYKSKEKFVLTSKLLVDSSGKKMGKTEGNMVAFSDTPEDMFGKVMSWTDGMIANGFELCTTLPMIEIKKMQTEVQNPRDLKLKLAFEIVKTFLGEKSARKAQEHFIAVFQHKEKPKGIITMELRSDQMSIAKVLEITELVSSRSEARRLAEQGGIKRNDEVVKNVDEWVKPGDIIQKGKRGFLKII